MTKKFGLLAVAILMVAAVALTGCAVPNTSATQAADDTAQATQAADAQTGTDTQTAADTDTAADTAAAADTDPDAIYYAFEFMDVDGNVHKLSDYAGKPVYLEIWASWCSVCKSSLPDIDALAATAEDFHVLSVVAPGYYGEKNTQDFISWWADQGYENLTVLVDEQHQVIFDFGVQAFPSQVFFDASGNFVGGRIGLMTPEQITEEMANIAQQ